MKKLHDIKIRIQLNELELCKESLLDCAPITLHGHRGIVVDIKVNAIDVVLRHMGPPLCDCIPEKSFEQP